jgi:hypothetical protein
LRDHREQIKGLDVLGDTTTISDEVVRAAREVLAR